MKHIFHHPVGVFPAAARWYLAGIAVLGLLSVAMQLSIQAYAQQQAKALIHAWGERAHVQIGDVRYHLLRNGLILRDIQIQRGGDSIGIAQMLLRANPKLLTGNAPRIGVIDISGFNAKMTRMGQADSWRNDNHLRQIWQAATAITAHDGHIKLYVHDKTAPPLDLSHVSIQQRLQYAKRSITGSARMQQGKVSWQWDMAAEPGSLSPQQKQRWPSTGWLKWQGLDAEKVTASLALQTMAGHLNGGLTWATNSLSGQHQASFNLRGDMQLDTGAGGKAKPAHRLQYVASKVDGRWQMDLDATAWPLDPWSDALPNMGERQLVSARIDGKMHWQGYPGNWHINSDQGVLHDVTYARPDGGEAQAWYWSRINYRQAAMHTAKHQFQLAGVDMLDSRLVLQTKRMDMVPHAVDKQAQEVAGEAVRVKPEHAVEAKDVSWDINVDHIKVQNMMLALAVPQGKLTLQALDGQIRSPKGKPLSFKLHTHEENHSGETTAPVAVKSSGELPHWQLRGKAEKNRLGQLSTANISIQGSHIPVARLRPLLPFQDDAERPVKLAGDAGFKAKISVDQGVWQMQGKASIRDVNLTYGGNVWQAEQVKVRFGPVGMGLDAQIIDSIESPAWQYTAVLRPLPLHVADSLNDAIDEPAEPAWWMTTLRNSRIAIHHLNLKNGRISVGQQQAVWAEKMQIDIDHMETDRWADIAIAGEIGGSDFHLNGQWQALSGSQGFRGDIALKQASPFFMHNWMVASGMPRLIRGRLSVGMHLDAGQDPGLYHGRVTFQLLQGLAETGVFTSDPMLARTGYSAAELLQRLEQRPGVISLQYNLNGLWLTQPLTLERVGLFLQTAMRDAARAGSWREEKAIKAKQSTIEARVRLHGRERLSLNERNRLSKVVHKLQLHPEMIIELRPKWTGKEMTAEILQRIRHTQTLIEHYITHRNVDKRRIFPIWPTAGDQVEEIGAIQVAIRIAG